MGDYLPRYSDGHSLTYTTSADVAAGQLVEITGDYTVAPAAAGSTKVVGVAGYDTTAGGRVTVHSGGVQVITAAASITAGQRVTPAADGEVTAWTTGQPDLGIALTAGAAGGRVEVSM